MPSLSPRTRLATMAASSAATAHLWQSANAFNDSSLQAVPKVSTFDVRILRLFVKGCALFEPIRSYSWDLQPFRANFDAGPESGKRRALYNCYESFRSGIIMV